MNPAVVARYLSSAMVCDFRRHRQHADARRRVHRPVPQPRDRCDMSEGSHPRERSRVAAAVYIPA